MVLATTSEATLSRPESPLADFGDGRSNGVLQTQPEHEPTSTRQPTALLAVVALVAACFGSMLGVTAALKWGPNGGGTAAAPAEVFDPAASTPVTSTSTAPASTSTSTSTSSSTSVPDAAAESSTASALPGSPALPSPEALAFAETVTADEGSHWLLELDPNKPEVDGLTLKGSSAQTNYPIMMVRDYLDAPIAWISPHGGISVTDNVKVKSSVWEDDRVSMRRWTDNVALTGPGGFSWDGAELVTTSVGASGSAQPLPGAPELWLRVMDNTGDEPRYLVIPAFLEDSGNP